MTNKKNIYKRMALLMVSCYVLNLLQYQISPILHALSHTLESPNSLIARSIQSTEEYEIHGHVEHSTPEISHGHEVIDFIDSILEASNEQESSEESWLNELKFDKHITIVQYPRSKYSEIKKLHSFWMRRLKSKRGHFDIPQEPPKSS